MKTRKVIRIRWSGGWEDTREEEVEEREQTLTIFEKVMWKPIILEVS